MQKTRREIRRSRKESSEQAQRLLDQALRDFARGEECERQLALAAMDWPEDLLVRLAVGTLFSPADVPFNDRVKARTLWHLNGRDHMTTVLRSVASDALECMGLL